MAKIHVIIPAAGSGSRMQQHIPKQFATIGDKTILEYVESIFSHISVIESISIAVSSSEKYIDNISHKFSKKKLKFLFLEVLADPKRSLIR